MIERLTLHTLDRDAIDLVAGLSKKL